MNFEPIPDDPPDTSALLSGTETPNEKADASLGAVTLVDTVGAADPNENTGLESAGAAIEPDKKGDLASDGGLGPKEKGALLPVSCSLVFKLLLIVVPKGTC